MSIKQWFLKKLKNALVEQDQRERDEIPGSALSLSQAQPYNSISGFTLSTPSNNVRHIRSTGMNFTLYSASGGWVLEYHSYDTVADQHENRIHIIHDSDEFGQQLANILTIELLRQ